MREPEFLPRWYPLLVRRRRTLFAQAMLSALVLIGLSVWALIGQRDAKIATSTLADVERQLAQTSGDLHRLEEIEAVNNQLKQQDQIIQRLGVHVPVSRMLAALDELMPPRMALRSLQFQTELHPLPLNDSERAVAAAPRLGRKLRLDLVGLAPTEDELATFLTRLVAVPYFGEVELVKAEDASDSGYLMRRFEVKFALDLDAPGVSVAGAGE